MVPDRPNPFTPREFDGLCDACHRRSGSWSCECGLVLCDAHRHCPECDGEPDAPDYQYELTRLADENNRLRATLVAYRDNGVPRLEEQQQEVARLNKAIVMMRANVTRLEEEVAALEADAESNALVVGALKEAVAALAAMCGGEVLCDDLVLRNLKHVNYDLKLSQGEQGITWKLEVAQPQDALGRLIHDNFLRLIASKHKK
jgi:hypothetical protein